MLSERGAYLSHEGDFVGIDMALERIWLDWEQKCLLTPIGAPIGVGQAVATILDIVESPKNFSSPNSSGELC